LNTDVVTSTGEKYSIYTYARHGTIERVRAYSIGLKIWAVSRMQLKGEVIRMDETKLINAMHDVLLDYCITTLRTKKAALAGHKDDFTAFDYGAYVGAKSMAITVLEHIDSQQETRKFLDRIYEEARREIDVEG
jgi:hypothetical protein